MEITVTAGGATKSKGGIGWIILPAGYLGSALWGMMMVIASVDDLATFAFASAFVLSLIIACVRFRRNVPLRLVCIFYIIVIVGMGATQFYTSFNGLQFFILFTGVMNGFFAIYDCIEDLVMSGVEESSSDAAVCGKLMGVSGRCIGVAWAFISLLLMSSGVLIALFITQ
mmetsp:Transcript_15365/g.18155  ORF Transcript_15365/g.18155 Transcript_15365/m.18155 type:complete len:170 (-) Transcript_15365:673-1182(-)